jgi:hypothetical protein
MQAITRPEELLHILSGKVDMAVTDSNRNKALPRLLPDSKTCIYSNQPCQLLFGHKYPLGIILPKYYPIRENQSQQIKLRAVEEEKDNKTFSTNSTKNGFDFSETYKIEP